MEYFTLILSLILCVQGSERFIVDSSLPTISKIEDNVSAQLHHDIKLHCEAKGIPTPTISWDYDKTRINNARQEGNDLFLQDVTKQNEGDYDCVALNMYGGARHTVRVSVISPVEVTLMSRVVVIDPKDVSGVVRVKCNATGNPTPTVTWSKYNMPPIVKDQNHLVFPDGEMVITGINSHNMIQFSGIYTCKADNKVSSAVAYQIIALKSPFSLVETTMFADFSVKPGKAIQGLCPAGTTQPDGSPISKEFEIADKVCVAARQVGAIGKEAASVTWVIKPNGHPEIVDADKGTLDLA